MPWPIWDLTGSSTSMAGAAHKQVMVGILLFCYACQWVMSLYWKEPMLVLLPFLLSVSEASQTQMAGAQRKAQWLQLLDM